MIIMDSQNRSGISEEFLPDFTPLLDVIFLLVIFLILVANSISYSISVSLPKIEHASPYLESSPDQEIVITLFTKGQGFKLDDHFYQTEKAFKTALLFRLSQRSNRQIIMICDHSVKIEDFLNLISFLQQQKITASEILVEKQPKG